MSDLISKSVVIKALEEKAEEHKELIELSRRYLIDTNELLEYQAIGTVEQLKAIKQWKSDVMEGFCKYDASSFEEIVVNARAKAIDEFAERLKKLYQAYDIDLCLQDNDYLNYTGSRIALESYIDEIAEQLKAGGKNE